MQRRRELLATFAAVGTVAGCSESEPSEGGRQSNSPGMAGTNSEPTQEAVTETEARFATTGNDSVLIEREPSELLISEPDIPKMGYTLTGTQDSSGDTYNRAQRTFADDADNTIFAGASVYNGVSGAERRYNMLDFNAHIGGVSPDESQELSIGVESKLETADTKDSFFSYLRFRDANAFGYLTWVTADSTVPVQDIGNLAVDMHESWR